MRYKDGLNEGVCLHYSKVSSSTYFSGEEETCRYVSQSKAELCIDPHHEMRVDLVKQQM